MTTAVTSETVRRELIDALRLDLVGPSNDHAFARELLPEPPSRWYLTGFLVPVDAPEVQKIDEAATEEVDGAGDTQGTDDAGAPDPAAARKKILPSSMGLSVLVPAEAHELNVHVSWGDYAYEGEEQEAVEGENTGDGQTDAGGEPQAGGQNKERKRGRRRIPRQRDALVTIPRDGKPAETALQDAGGLVLIVTARPVSGVAVVAGRLPAGTRSVSVFLVNRRPPQSDGAYKAFAFQAGLRVTSPIPFVPRPDLRGGLNGGLDDWDERLADLQYRDVFEYAVGHGVSAESELEADGSCRGVRTTWIPSAEVERVAPADISDVERRMEALGSLADGADASAKLSPLVAGYRAWIAAQRSRCSGLEPDRARTAEDLCVEAEAAASRIEAGIALLADPQVLEAFRTANRVMARAARQREAMQRQTDPSQVPAPEWRPFQLAFILMTLRGILDPFHAEREAVDLLFFPTGGGKTEAYLGLAAFALVLRRLRNPGIRSAGMTVLMRYTLRLLTLDQLGRAAALTCALELEREQDPAKLGSWPFEIGLWVGQAATPNRMGWQGYRGPGEDQTAYIKTRRFQQGTSKTPPIPTEQCPWCGTKLTKASFRLVPNAQRPKDLKTYCVNYQCPFSGAADRPLPIVAVDEPLYRRLPGFVIATVDKFAALPWTGEVGGLFGLVNSFDRDGFYGPCSDRSGSALPDGLPAPDLIIQDELHLISGPLGTIAGLYEAALDALATRTVDGRPVRPKIIASTATVRRAETQIRALFERPRVSIFPPPGVDRRDTYFARTLPAAASPARLYVGVAAQGRSLKVVLLRAALALLSAAQVAYAREGGQRNLQNPGDPYMTLLGYFNSLRELGGSRRIVEDEVTTRLSEYGRRRRLEPADRIFKDRKIAYEVLELTSRVPTDRVADAKRRLSLPFFEDERVDVALATNMISVGLDIIRLGLMVVLGQPKTSAEYIQATSRVGRDPDRPGLIVSLLNVHKPRDRSHYERFAMYHASFYRGVEPTSVTPFSPRALDRALPATLVGLCRHANREMVPSLGAGEILRLRSALTRFAQILAERARNHRAVREDEGERLYARVYERCNGLLNDWLRIAEELRRNGTQLQYQQDPGTPGARLLYEFLHPDLPGLPAIRRKFRAHRSMRDVEPNVTVVVKNLNDWGNQP